LAAHQVNVLIYGGFQRFLKFYFYVSTCQGGDSDEENVEESPDEDQYDTDDPFIDDEELNEYFMVEKAKTKHTGFFINRGALEKM
jgi:hypothetical protein